MMMNLSKNKKTNNDDCDEMTGVRNLTQTKIEFLTKNEPTQKIKLGKNKEVSELGDKNKVTHANLIKKNEISTQKQSKVTHKGDKEIKTVKNLSNFWEKIGTKNGTKGAIFRLKRGLL